MTAKNGRAVPTKAAPKPQQPGRSPTSTAKLVERIEALEASNVQLKQALTAILTEMQRQKAKQMAAALGPKLEEAILQRMNGGGGGNPGDDIARLFNPE